MQIFVEGNAVRYIDGDINLSTAKGNITQIKISNTKIAFKSLLITQKSFEVADIRNAANVSYGATADAVILALSSLVFDVEGGVIPITPDLQAVSDVGRNSNKRLQFNAVDYATVNDLNTITPSFDRPRKTQEYFYDFIGASLGTPMSFYTQGGGANASNASNVDTEIGALSFSTGTTNTGRAGIAVQVFDCLTGGVGTYTIETFLKISLLSNITQRFSVISGFGNLMTGQPTNGVYFKYDDSISANWLIRTSNNGVPSQTITSVPVTTNYVKLKVIFSPTIATFFINDLNVGNLTNTLPIGLTRLFSFVPANIIKSIGNTACNMRIDYTNFKIDLTTSR